MVMPRSSESDGSTSDLTAMTCGDCARYLAQLKTAFGRVRIDITTQPMWEALVDVRWLAGFDEDWVVLGNFGPPFVDRVRAIRGFRHAVFVKRTTSALERASEFSGFKAKAKHIKNWDPRDPSERAHQADARLYEVELAARLSFVFQDVRFDGPDLMVRDPATGFVFSIACKRPRERPGIARGVRSAGKQIREAGELGLVAISLDRLVNQVVDDRSGRTVEGECGGRMDVIMLGSLDTVFKELRKAPPCREELNNPDALSGVLGALITGYFFYVARDGAGGNIYANTGLMIRFATIAEDEWARGGLKFLAECVKAGEQQLIAASMNSTAPE